MTESSINTLARPDQIIDSSTAFGSSRRRVWTLAVACLGVTLVAARRRRSTPHCVTSGGTTASKTQLNWTRTTTASCWPACWLPAGAIGDRYGRRGALLVGLAIFSAASVAPIIFHSPVPIIISRALSGAGAAFVMPATLSLLTVAYPKEQRTKAVGIWAGVAGSGGVLGMLCSGLLLHFWDWRSIFWALAVGGALIFVLTLTVSNSRDHDAPGIEAAGAALIGVAVAVFVFGILQAPTRGWTDPVIDVCLGTGLLLAAVSDLSNPAAGDHFSMCGCSAIPASPPGSRPSRWCSSPPSGSSMSACSISSRSWATRRW